MENLVIRLGSSTSDPVHWLVWSATESEIIASGVLPNAEQLSSLSERAGSRPITALVPGCDVLLKWVLLPAKASRKALTAIPFMLEEELSTNINEQFFALGPRVGQQQAVAVVKKDSLQAWLDAIKQAGLECDKLLPDVLAVPHAESAWSFVTLGQQAIIRQDQWQGLQGDLAWVLPAVEHFAKQQPTPLQIENYSDQALSNLANVQSTDQPLEMPMQLLATGALTSDFNLLQGEFKVKKQANHQWHQWRLAAGLAGLALLATLIDRGIEINKLKHENDQLSAQIQAEYQRAFPNSPKPRLVRETMKKRLAALESGGASVSMLAVMSQLSDAFASSNIKPQTLRFDTTRSELRLQAVANNYESLEIFKRLAEESGFVVQQGAINNRDNQVIGSLTIRS